MSTSRKPVALLIDAENEPRSTQQIVQFCKRYGSLRIKRAYGNWKHPSLSSHVQTVARLGITRIQPDRIGENAADDKLIEDVRTLLEKGEIKIFVIVSSDGDLKPICERIHLTGANVIVIGKSEASKELRQFCDQFISIDEIVRAEILIEAYQNTPQKDGGILLSQIRAMLTQIDKQFEKRFAGKRLSTWFKSFPNQFELVDDNRRVRMR